MMILQMWPLSQEEILGIPESFIDRVFQQKSSTDLFTTNISIHLYDLLNKTSKGGYPALQYINDERVQYDWVNGYISTIIERDIQDLAHIEQKNSILEILKIYASYLFPS